MKIKVTSYKLFKSKKEDRKYRRLILKDLFSQQQQHFKPGNLFEVERDGDGVQCSVVVV